MNLIQHNSCRQLFRETIIYFKSNQKWTILLDKIEYMMRDIDIKTDYSSKKKSWKYRFLLGRTTTRWKKNNSLRCVQHPTKEHFLVNTSNVFDRKEVVIWKLKLYKMACTLLKMINKQWAGSNDDFVVQFSCMDIESHIEIHTDKDDVSSQFAISLGEYKGGQLMVYNDNLSTYIPVVNKRKMVQFDGRKKHFVTKVTEGERYYIVFFKSYDESYDYQSIFTGIKTYTEI